MNTTSISKIQPGDESATHPQYTRWKYVIPLPPLSLMWSVGGATTENFLVVGDAWAQLVSRFTPPHATVLDIGCGCGRVARVLVNNPFVRSYVGFDVIEANVAWSRAFIVPPEGREFRFLHYDLYSREYNPTGSVQVRSFRFPCADGTANVVFAASVFTHLLEPDCRHYLRETARVLGPGGTALLSIHNQVPPGERFVGTETRIDMLPDYFSEMAAQVGLRELERIDDFAGQQVFIFRK